MSRVFSIVCSLGVLLNICLPCFISSLSAADRVRDLQNAAIKTGQSPVAHWGNDPQTYAGWSTHTNRLVPVYTYGTRGKGPGVDLDDYIGAKCLYRNADAIRKIYGRLPDNTLNPLAEYMDQTDIATLQRAAIAAGKKHVILIVFDGMDWQTTHAASTVALGKVPYASGRGQGLHFQDYAAGGTSQFGYMVTSPHNEGTKVNVDTQRVSNPGGTVRGGYDARKAGPNPWKPGDDSYYPMCKVAGNPLASGAHAYTDSSSSASSMTAGIKTYNNGVNVDAAGEQVSTIALDVQAAGWAVGAVSSVPISHATPACTYAHNVDRDDYQDLTRDMLGRPSISHPIKPLPGMDVVIGGGHGVEAKVDGAQGRNFVPGNVFLTAEDLRAIDVAQGGRYVVAQRTAGVAGGARLSEAADEAARTDKRLFGFYGVGKYKGHLPFQTADRDFVPALGRALKAETYSTGDLQENPTLADMTAAALKVLSQNRKGFWLMVEPGDVDWANHDNNLDNSIGAVFSGDAAVKVVTDWVEAHSNWNETLLIVTADHGHYLNLDRPELLVGDAPAGGAK